MQSNHIRKSFAGVPDRVHDYIVRRRDEAHTGYMASQTRSAAISLRGESRSHRLVRTRVC
jgi:hypothetical protein